MCTNLVQNYEKYIKNSSSDGMIQPATYLIRSNQRASNQDTESSYQSCELVIIISCALFERRWNLAHRNRQHFVLVRSVKF